HPEEAVGLIAPKLGLSEEEQGHFTVAHYDDNSYIAPEWIASWVNRGEEWGLWPLGAVQSEDLYSNDYLRVKIYR
ncbi:MAG: hypothetical protein LBT22_05995, partial [Peptococcaceae bacterium]|nr:hypothetical protein [Peptococcaceae bacterium]